MFIFLFFYRIGLGGTPDPFDDPVDMDTNTNAKRGPIVIPETPLATRRKEKELRRRRLIQVFGKPEAHWWRTGVSKTTHKMPRPYRR